MNQEFQRSTGRYDLESAQRAILEEALNSFEIGDLSEPEFLSILGQLQFPSRLYLEFYDRARALGLFQEQLWGTTTIHMEEASFAELHGVDIFRAGQHTDSQGTGRSFSTDDLKLIHSNFNSKKVSSVPLKLGHTTPEFTSKVAKALEIPETLLTGDSDNNNRGRASLGEVVSLSTNGTIKANIKFANDKVAQLIKDNYFTDVSVELLRRPGDNGKEDLILSGLALLGGERPAIKGLGGLQAATMLDDGTLPNELYVGSWNPQQFALKDPGNTELVWDVPVQELESKKTVSVIHHRAPTAETALSEIVHAVGAGLREFTTVVGQGAAGVVVLLLGRRYLFGKAALAKQGTPVDSTFKLLTKIKSVIGKTTPRTPASSWITSSEADLEKLLGVGGVPGASFSQEQLEVMMSNLSLEDQAKFHELKGDQWVPTPGDSDKNTYKAGKVLPGETLAHERQGLAAKAIESLKAFVRKPSGFRTPAETARVKAENENLTKLINLGLDQETIKKAREAQKKLQQSPGYGDSVWSSSFTLSSQYEEEDTMWTLTYKTADGESKVSTVEAESEEAAKAKAPEGATDVSVTKKEEKGEIQEEEFGALLVGLGIGAAILAAVAVVGSIKQQRAISQELQPIIDTMESGKMSLEEGQAKIRQIVKSHRLSEEEERELLDDLDEAFLKAKNKKGKKEKEEASMSEISKALGLSEKATGREILKSIVNLQSMTAKFSETEFRGLQVEVKSLRRKDRISIYREQTEPLSLIKGTPVELATKLVNLEEQSNEATAKDMLDIWQQTQKSAEAAGALVPLLNARHFEEDNSNFEAAVDKHMEDNPKATRGEAYKVIMTKSPALYANGQK